MLYDTPWPVTLCILFKLLPRNVAMPIILVVWGMYNQAMMWRDIASGTAWTVRTGGMILTWIMQERNYSSYFMFYSFFDILLYVPEVQAGRGTMFYSQNHLISSNCTRCHFTSHFLHVQSDISRARRTSNKRCPRNN